MVLIPAPGSATRDPTVDASFINLLLLLLFFVLHGLAPIDAPAP